MKSRIKWLLSFILIISIVILSSCSLMGGIEIANYDITITLDDAGNALFEETYVMHYPDGYHGRFQDISYLKKSFDVNTKNTKNASSQAVFVEESVVIEVLDEEGKTIKNVYEGYSFNGDKDMRDPKEYIECYPSQPNCESLYVYLSNGIPSTVTFKYTYKIENIINQYSDISEFNWRLYKVSEERILKEASVTINLPNNNHSTDYMYIWGHGVSKGTINFESNKKIVASASNMKVNEQIEIRVLVPNDVFSNYDSNKKINVNAKAEIIEYQASLADMYNLQILVANLCFYSLFIMIIVTGIVIFQVWKKYDKEFEAMFQGEYMRELPQEYSPAIMSYLYYFKRINDEDVTATLLDLIRRKYLALDENGEDLTKKKPNFKIILINDDYKNKLSPHEELIIEWFIQTIGDGKEVTLREIEKYPLGNYQKANQFSEYGKRFKTLVTNEGRKYDFFDKTTDAAKSKVSFYGVILIIYAILCSLLGVMFSASTGPSVFVGIILTVVYFIYIAGIKRRSKNGNEDYAKWKAFANFLKDFSEMKDYPMPGIIVWEHYLVYATSLKMADLVMRQLKIKLPETVDMSNSTYLGFGYRVRGFYIGYTFNSLNRTLNTARQNGVNTIVQHNASRVSSGGRGGGFGGGSSFGGGGMGGRSH